MRIAAVAAQSFTLHHPSLQGASKNTVWSTLFITTMCPNEDHACDADLVSQNQWAMKPGSPELGMAAPCCREGLYHLVETDTLSIFFQMCWGRVCF